MPAHSVASAGRPLLSLLATLIGTAVLPALAAPSPDLVAPNFVCDSVRQVCFDANGPAVIQTGRTYGNKAERDLLRELSGRPPVTIFSFSNGALCDLRQRTCWDDGNRRSNVSYRLSQHLFSGTAPVGARSCQLSQRGRKLFEGACSLSRRTMLPAGTSYVVETQDGRRYTFYNEGYGRLVLRDATGVWPVTTGNIGNLVAFRWADVQLLASRPYGVTPWGSGQGYGYGQGYGGYGQPSPDPRGATPSTPAQALEQLLNSLFR